MSQISQKSISGITSITSPAGIDNQFTLHTNDTSQAAKLDSAGNFHFSNHVNTTGITSASNFKTGSSNLHSTGLTVGDTFVHSTGVNASSLDVDDFVDVGSNIKLGNAGVVTATTFSTANVDINTDKIVVGTGVTIEANQVATGQATFTGIVTASSFRGDGSQLTGITGTTINNNTANRIITGEGGTTLNGEANFTFDGTNLVLAEGVEFKMGTSSNFELISINGNKVRMQAQQTNFHIETSNNNSIVLRTNRNGSYNGIIIDGSGDVKPNADSTVDLGSNSVRFANIYADTYYGNGANLTGIEAGQEVYGFTGIGNSLSLTTTNNGADNIDGATYAAFEENFIGPSGISFSINTSGNLIMSV